MSQEQTLTIPEQLDLTVFQVLGKDSIKGFVKAYEMAKAIKTLKALLTVEYMAPIMDLQGNRLGFRTDKDRNQDGSPGPGYSLEIVKNCLIEAVLTGIQPVGNQFNIIAGNMYPTKEGFGYLLDNYPGLSYKIVPQIPRVNQEQTSAVIVMRITWRLNGGAECLQDLELPIKMNKFMGIDAVIGKATRKARAWLYATLTGFEIPDGDISDLNDIKSTVKITRSPEEIELDRKKQMLADCTTIDELDLIQNANPDWDITLFNERREAINGSK